MPARIMDRDENRPSLSPVISEVNYKTPLENFQLIVFDLDGTLIDSLPDIANTINMILASEGYPIHPMDAYADFVGWGVKQAIEDALPERVSPELIDKMAAAVVSEYERQPVLLSRVYDGIPELLESIYERDVPMVIFTNKPEKSAQAIAERFFPQGYMSAVFGQRADYPAKPDPIALKTRLGTSYPNPSSVLFVGDTPVDVQTAANAGNHFVGAGWGFRDIPDLISAGSETNFGSPEALHRWLLGENTE